MNDQSNLDEFISKYKIPLALGLVGLVLLIGGLVSSGVVSKTFIKSTKSAANFQKTTAAAPTTIKVDVSGAVSNPGVYILDSQSRMEDAIRAAGGVTIEVDSEYLTKSINLAQRLSDGTKIYIPIAGDSEVPVTSSTVAGVSAQQTIININNASLADLDKLSGVGPVTAQKIIDNRPYSGIEELLIKKAVSRSVYEKIKGQVSVY